MTFTAADSQCPHPNGRFASADQCDAYTECSEGDAVEKLCPDGLLFHQRTKSTGECIYAPLSICQERTKQQPANGTDECPRQFGFYASGDARNCGSYKNCAHGEATVTQCPESLAFNVQTYQCDWPDLVEECDAEAYLGFHCPPTVYESTNAVGPEVDVGAEGELRYFAHPEECRKYFVCVNGRPRLANCGKHLAFNPESKLCESRSHVPACFVKKIKS